MTKRKADCDEKMNKGRGGTAPSVSANIERSKLGEAEDFLQDELLPNIPNHLALQMIVPKLSARGINILSLVSPTWQEAIHRRWVYDERVRSHSTDTFVVAFTSDQESHGFRTYKLRLYSLNDNSAYDLPPVPSCERGRGCKCIALDGKIYILGGAPGHTASRKVFMLDLAGQRQWKECASMQEERHGWGAGILDGKIYVFGGWAGINRKSVCQSEVYDPKIDAWSSIADSSPWRRDSHVATVGEELFVHCGQDPAMQNFGGQQNLVAYHPIKNEWREIVDFNTGDRVPWFDAFQAQGKIYTITQDGIDVYDIETNSWNPLHSFSGLEENLGEFSSSIVETRYDGLHILPLGDEVLILRQDHSGCNSHNNRDYYNFEGYHDYRTSILGCIRLVQSRGLGTKNREFAVEEIGNCRLSFDLCNSPHFEIMCVIQL